MSNSEIEQSGTIKGHLPNETSLSGRISNGLSLSGHISIGSRSGDFIIKMTIEVNGDNYTVTSCDKTMEQIDAAVASGQNIKAIAFDKFIMPMTQIMEYGVSYTFGAFLGSFLVAANVYKNPESGTDDWEFYLVPLTADIVEYSNTALPNISTVGGALDALVPNSHTHSNKLVLDKFSETDGKPTYNGEALGGGTSDFVIKMTLAYHDDGDYYTVTSCDTTIEQIDAAVAAEKRVVLIATDTTTGMFWELPIVQAFQGETYIFIAFTYSGYIIATVYKSGENEIWEYMNGGISSESIHYFNSAQPDVETVMAALNKLFDKSHTHSNKDTLDKLSDSNGKLQYNGSDVGLKGEKGDTPVKGTDYWTAADKQEIIDDIHPTYYIDLAGKYPNYTCPVAMDDIKAAYHSGYNIVCRCMLGVYTATLPLFVPMPAANTWIFSGSGCLQSMGFPAQSFTIAITANGVVAQNKELVALGGTLPNPYELQITVGDTSYIYDGSEYVNIVIDDGTEVSY